MLGRYTPFYSLAFRFIPGIDLFRRPTDASFVFVIAIAFIAGHCLADYARSGLPRLRPPSALLALTVSLAVIGSAIAFSARTAHAPEATREAVTALAVMLAAGLFLFAMRGERTRAPAAAVIAFAAVAELLWWKTPNPSIAMRCFKRRWARTQPRSRCWRSPSQQTTTAAIIRASRC
jgi:4-amino-4-deoxy-L-arabinose transferase-like glycosyltransferase